MVTKFFEKAVEAGNRYGTLSSLIFRKNEFIFFNIEIMLLVILAMSVGVLLFIHQLPFWSGFILSLLLAQRLFEYLIVYSRNFILNRGRVFSHFAHSVDRGLWLILTFFLNITQAIVTFAIWYRFISTHIPGSFSSPLNILDSLYFSVVTFFTIGFGDIVPVAAIAKTLAMFEAAFAFYTVVIVINGLIMMHFKGTSSR